MYNKNKIFIAIVCLILGISTVFCADNSQKNIRISNLFQEKLIKIENDMQKNNRSDFVSAMQKIIMWYWVVDVKSQGMCLDFLNKILGNTKDPLILSFTYLAKANCISDITTIDKKEYIKKAVLFMCKAKLTKKEKEFYYSSLVHNSLYLNYPNITDLVKNKLPNIFNNSVVIRLSGVSTSDLKDFKIFPDLSSLSTSLVKKSVNDHEIKFSNIKDNNLDLVVSYFINNRENYKFNEYKIDFSKKNNYFISISAAKLDLRYELKGNNHLIHWNLGLPEDYKKYSIRVSTGAKKADFRRSKTLVGTSKGTYIIPVKTVKNIKDYSVKFYVNSTESKDKFKTKQFINDYGLITVSELNL